VPAGVENLSYVVNLDHYEFSPRGKFDELVRSQTA
jgi:hypothetical protein